MKKLVFVFVALFTMGMAMTTTSCKKAVQADTDTVVVDSADSVNADSVQADSVVVDSVK